MTRERRIRKGVAAERPSFGRRVALGAEMLVNFNGISKDHCLVHRLRATVSRKHLASFIQGGHRPDVQLVSYRRFGWFRPEQTGCLPELMAGSAEVGYH
jgi:hypothetical protein